MEKLFEMQRIIIEQFEERPFYWRSQFDSLPQTEVITGILGARGVGKTTFLLNHVINSGAKKRKALYVSADNIFFLEHRLLDVVDYLYKQTDVRLLCIDEIHKYPNWRMELKNIADTYSSFQIFFSGSSMIDLSQGKYDLSRRVLLHRLSGFSFREYLEYYQGVKIPILSFEKILSSHLEIAQDFPVTQVLKHFNDYLRIGYYPFFQGFTRDLDKFQSLENAVQMTIYEDIGTFHSLKTSSLSTIELLYKYIINSSPGEINASKLAKNLGKDFDTISDYLRYLEQAGLIRFIYSNSGGNSYLRNPIKMYPDNTNLIYAASLSLLQDQERGKVRETFVVNQMQNQKNPIFFSQKGDFKINDVIFEVGGKSKSTAQIRGEEKAFILADDILVGSKSTIPLYLFGMLY
ncbi:MAG: AAA family ATPase [Chlamydiae bacterium]|nr:AAA family ATPase [Chlamydiota bacterium]